MSESASTLSCTRCGAGISNDDLSGGLAVRVDGDLVCQMCVDTLPGEAVVRINQVRAMRGLEATTYAVKLAQAPRLQLFSFTTAANVTHHRRKLASDGFFEAPPLPPPSERTRLPTSAEAPKKIVTDRVARGQLPAKVPMLLAGGATVIVLGSIALALALAAPAKRSSATEADAAPTEIPSPEPVRQVKTRLDYPVDPLLAWVQSEKDSDCPALVRQGIAQEVIRKRGMQLADADQALSERRLDDATALANALSLPDDIAFRDLRRHENDLRARLLASRTLATAPKPDPTTISPTPPPVAPPVQPTPPPDDGRMILLPDAADISGTSLKPQDAGGRRNLGFWSNPTNSPRWPVSVTKPGRYRIDVLMAIQAGPTEAVLEIAGRQVESQFAATGSWDRFTSVTMGVVELKESGATVLRLRPKDPTTWRPINLARISLIPTSDGETATAIPPTPPPMPTPPPSPPAAMPVVAWNGAFFTGGRDKPPREVALNGSEHVPSGLPGGVTALFRSNKSQALKRHAAFLDLGGAKATGGGVVVLVHPGRNDRNELIPSLTDGKGTTVKLPAVALEDDAWTSILLPLPDDGSLDGTQLITLALEDSAKATHIPDDAGFLIASAVIVNGRAATAADLGLRPSALLPDANRLRNLPRLLDLLAKSRKKSTPQKLIEPGRLRFLLGGWGDDKDWRTAMRRQLEPFVPGKQPTTMMAEIAFTDEWLGAMTKGKDAALDPQNIHIGVLWTGGDEVTAFPDAQQTIATFWKQRLDQLIEAGVLPIVVLGPNRQTGDRRATADQVWQQLIALPPIRLYSMPVIDLRALTTAADGSWDAATAALARQLVVDAIAETVFSLRRLGAIK